MCSVSTPGTARFDECITLAKQAPVCVDEFVSDAPSARDRLPQSQAGRIKMMLAVTERSARRPVAPRSRGAWYKNLHCRGMNNAVGIYDDRFDRVASQQ